MLVDGTQAQGSGILDLISALRVYTSFHHH